MISYMLQHGVPDPMWISECHQPYPLDQAYAGVGALQQLHGSFTRLQHKIKLMSIGLTVTLLW